MSPCFSDSSHSTPASPTSVMNERRNAAGGALLKPNENLNVPAPGKEGRSVPDLLMLENSAHGKLDNSLSLPDDCREGSNSYKRERVFIDLTAPNSDSRDETTAHPLSNRTSIAAGGQKDSRSTCPNSSNVSLAQLLSTDDFLGKTLKLQKIRCIK